VTAVERWIANPYALFAERILGLEPLPPIGGAPNAAVRGQIVHAALRRFAHAYPERLPADIAGALLEFLGAELADLMGSPAVSTFWVPRLRRFAAWFAASEPGRRHGALTCLAEVAGRMVFPAPAGDFTLTARADRIDVGAGGIAISDYKSGANLERLAQRARSGEAPQLALEAAIAAAGGFQGVAAWLPARLRYIATAGGEPPGAQIDLADGVDGLADRAREGLRRLVAEFDDAATPYRALRRVRFSYTFDPYAHLARVAEWSLEESAEAEA
jgi:ATP-dependent helicase/nuclease subunit B